jgi:hypothetical protein
LAPATRLDAICLYVVRALCIAALIACRSPSPGHPGTGQPPELTPESLGLPATPEPDPVRPPPVRPPYSPVVSAFYNHQACPPGRYGCVFSRTVTDERVTTRLDCPSPYSSYVGGRSLRHLAVADVSDAALRPTIVRALDGLRRCFGATSERVDIELIVGANGTVLAATNTAADALCVHAVVMNLRFTGTQQGRFRVDYSVEDPAAHVKPIECP